LRAGPGGFHSERVKRRRGVSCGSSWSAGIGWAGRCVQHLEPVEGMREVPLNSGTCAARGERAGPGTTLSPASFTFAETEDSDRRTWPLWCAPGGGPSARGDSGLGLGAC
jgi:hypothetical protein